MDVTCNRFVTDMTVACCCYLHLQLCIYAVFLSKFLVLIFFLIYISNVGVCVCNTLYVALLFTNHTNHILT